MSWVRRAQVLAACATFVFGCRQARVEQRDVDPSLVYYIAVDGRDTWSGRLPAPAADGHDGPFATLERARDEIRELRARSGLPRGGVTVRVRGGRYERTQAFVLTSADSGTSFAPITYGAYNGEQVRVSGGRVIREFIPVEDARVRARLAPAAAPHIVQADLRAAGIHDYGAVEGGGLEVFFDDRPMTLARWPNEGFEKITEVVGGRPMTILGRSGDAIGRFRYDDARPQRWIDEPDGWLHGYWFWDWAEQRQRIAAIDPARREIALVPPHHKYGYRSGQWYYAFNLLSELDQPGEWYLDRERGLLYFWPPSTSGTAVVSLAADLLEVRGASFVTFDGLDFSDTRGTAVRVTDAHDVVIKRCRIENVGKWGVVIDNSSRTGVAGCEIAHTGQGGISLAGGDRRSLRTAENYAEDNRIHHFARWNRMGEPGIRIDGVGSRVRHNHLHDAPHTAVWIYGNDHTIELNEIHDVCEEVNDGGAIYAGRDWSMRGTIIRHNYIHDIRGFEGRGAYGVCLDDMFSGTLIEGNVFDGIYRAVLIGGGRDNVVRNNLFLDCKPAVHVDGRGTNWAANLLPQLTEKLRALPYREEPWRSRYPALVNLLESDPAAPRGNRIVQNVFWRGQALDLAHGTSSAVAVERNLVENDPALVEKTRDEVRLRDTSRARSIDFESIPFERIGPRSYAGRRATR